MTRRANQITNDSVVNGEIQPLFKILRKGFISTNHVTFRCTPHLYIASHNLRIIKKIGCLTLFYFE